MSFSIGCSSRRSSLCDHASTHCKEAACMSVTWLRCADRSIHPGWGVLTPAAAQSPWLLDQSTHSASWQTLRPAALSLSTMHMKAMETNGNVDHVTGSREPRANLKVPLQLFQLRFRTCTPQVTNNEINKPWLRALGPWCSIPNWWLSSLNTTFRGWTHYPWQSIWHSGVHTVSINLFSMKQTVGIQTETEPKSGSLTCTNRNTPKRTKAYWLTSQYDIHETSFMI